MKRLFFLILFAIIGIESFAQSKESFLFTVEGYIVDVECATPFDNFPIVIFPNVTDTTNKYTVYTNKEGYYHLTIRMYEYSDLKISLRGNCNQGWTEYFDIVKAFNGRYKKNFSICHNPEWYMQKLVIQGVVYDSVVSEPVPNHLVIITSNRNSLLFNSCKTDDNGFYTDTFVVNIFDTVKFSVNTYSFCEKALELVSYNLNEVYSETKQIDFNICTKNSFDWSVTFYHKIYSSTNKVYFSSVSSVVVDSILWDFGDGTFGRGYDALHQYEGGSYKVKMTAYLNGDTREYIDRVVVGNSISLSGEVLASGTLLNKGYVVAVAYDKSVYSVMGMCEISNGQFVFDDILRGNYFFYAIPEFDIDTLYFPKYIGTYTDGNYNWQNTELFTVDNKNDFVTIDLYKNDEVYFGHNEINFSATEELLYKYDVVNVVLYDSENKPLNSVPIISLETFSFKNLPEGKYSIKVEIPGCLSKPYSFYLSSDNQPNIVFFSTNENEIGYFVGDIDIEETNLKIFPNPFSEKIFIESKKYPLNLEIYNSCGQLIDSHEIKQDEIINTNDFEEGIYVIVLKTESEIVDSKVIIKN